MKIFGGVLLIIIGAFFLIGSVFNVFDMFFIFLNSDLSDSYDIGFLIGMALVIVVFSALAYKSICKGIELVRQTS